MSHSDTTMVMQAGFPRDLHADVTAVSAIVSGAGREPVGSFRVTIAGQPITIPYRVYYEEPAAEHLFALSARQQLLLGCWYTRHHDGFVRQSHLEHIIGSPQPWVVPYVVRLAGEYVIEILEIIRRELTMTVVAGTAHHGVYGRFVADNPVFVGLTAQRVASYWDCYHRTRYPGFEDSPGKDIVNVLRLAGSTMTDATPQRNP